MNKFFLVVLLSAAISSEAKVQVISRDPYIGAIAVAADSGQVLFAENADVEGYPASVLKLMDLLIIVEKIEQGALRLTDQVHVTAESSKTGGSQVYLKEHEVFSIEELLFALMIQSANDAAVALAIHIAGSKDGFVSLMNEKARQLGMTRTRFHSVHGLPPGQGQEPDVSTARDVATLCLELAKHPDVFRYTSAQERPFRPDAQQPFIMRTHNHLLGRVEGCDGFKTGYFTAAGFSIAVTAQRDGRRVICVVLGSPVRDKRDAKASELLSKAFLILPPAPPPEKKIELPPPEPLPAAPAMEASRGGHLATLAAGVLIGVIAAGAMGWFVRRRNGAAADFVKRP